MSLALEPHQGETTSDNDSVALRGLAIDVGPAAGEVASRTLPHPLLPTALTVAVVA